MSSNFFIAKSTGEEIIERLEGIAPGADQLSADALKDGTTNKAYTDAEQTKLSNIDLGATVDTDDEIVALLEAITPGAAQLSLDALKEGTTNLLLTAGERALIAAEPQYQLLENEFAVASSTVWADAIPAGSVVLGLKYINKTIVGATTAVEYKINLSGGTAVDLATGIALTQNTKSNSGIAEQACAGTTDVNLTPDAGTLDTGTVQVGILIRKALTNYPSV